MKGEREGEGSIKFCFDSLYSRHGKITKSRARGKTIKNRRGWFGTKDVNFLSPPRRPFAKAMRDAKCFCLSQARSFAHSLARSPRAFGKETTAAFQ